MKSITISASSIYLAIDERTFFSGFILNDFEANTDSKITIGKPTDIADNKNINGDQDEYHNGCIFVGAITIRVPRDD